MTVAAARVFDRVEAIARTWDRYTAADRIGVSDKYEAAVAQLAIRLSDPEVVSKSALLWIAPEMTALLLHASATLPSYTFQSEVLPWRDAIVVSESAWFTVADRDTNEAVELEVFQWMKVNERLWFASALTDSFRPGFLSPFAHLPLVPGYEWSDGPTNDTQSVMVRLLCTLWLLIQQRVAVRGRSEPNRAAARRWARCQDTPVPDVITIELRRPQSVGGERDQEAGFVDWSHRWLVDGHWRNQWHPTTRMHVPTWIAPYVKGPEDKPLVVKRRVNAWVR